MTDPVWCRTSATLWRRTTSAAVLLPPGADHPVRLEGAAALVWDLIEEPISEAETADVLARACGEEPARIAPDVATVLRQLEALGAARPQDAARC